MRLRARSSPDRLIENTEAADVLAPKRQAEIAEVAEVLKRFRPTKVAVEAKFSNDARAGRYQEYVAGDGELQRNESLQIGFRLAGELGHETVYPVDVDGEFPWPRLVDYAKASGLDRLLRAQPTRQRPHRSPIQFPAHHACRPKIPALPSLSVPEGVSIIRSRRRRTRGTGLPPPRRERPFQSTHRVGEGA